MYSTQCKKAEIEGETCTLYGVSDGSGFCFDFTTDEKAANKFAAFLNENDVEPCHVQEIIEDLFYSCGE